MIGGALVGPGLLALALSGTIAVELVDRGSPPVASFAALRAPAAAAPSRTISPGIDVDHRMSEILARPVFSPDRRPIGAAAHSVTGLTRLTGIVVSGSRKIAIFAAASGGQPVVVEEGGRLNAFEVTAINDAGVTVVGPSGTSVITPIFDPTPPRPTAKPLLTPVPVVRPEPLLLKRP